MKVFARKATALKYVKPGQVIGNDDIKKYFIVKDYKAYIDLIHHTPHPSFYEFIPEDVYINLFLDIEIYKQTQPNEFEGHQEVITGIQCKLKEVFEDGGLRTKFITLSSHTPPNSGNEEKKSYHIVVRLYNGETDEPVYFRGVKNFKTPITALFPDLVNKKIVDTSVYREGLFRTYLSSKKEQQRPLVKDNTLGDNFEAIESFVCYCPDASDTNLVLMEQFQITANERREENDVHIHDDIEVIEPIQKDLTDKDKDTVKKFVRKNYKYRNKDIREIVLNHELNCINVNLFDTFCFNLDREHKSNHQYIVIDTYSSKQKCHDTDCKDYKHNEIHLANFPKELNELLLKCLKVNKREQELIEKAIQDCKDYITNNFDENIEEIQFDRNEMVFKGNASNTNMMVIRGKCTSCKLEHHITNNGYCLKCSVCNTIYPKNQVIPVDDRYKNLNSFWMNYNQLVNNGTVNININNYYNGEEEFSCDIQLDNSIFRNKEMTKLYNQILDGHKVVLLSQLMSKIEVDFKYTNGEWYFFNGMIWKQDKESLEFRKRTVRLSNNFNRILSFYESKKAGEGHGIIMKNIKSLINKLHKTGFEDEIIKGAKMYYNDEHFFSNLNSKKHLVPFSNGVYDLLENKFRKTTKEDYVNLIVNYDYNVETKNLEVIDFINKVLPNKGVRDYVLKKMSECLNGDIPNTNFLMFIGDGANGKSQLLNLMKLTMGDLGEKVEVTLLTRKRNNANEANTEKIKLMNKRFAFLSEPEDGEKINIGLLKELTGSEEIVARGLYQEAVSFVMEAKLFLACNELPEIKGEDTALWRRIRVIDFPSRFVEDPKEENEYKIDRTLPSRMREDITWRQTFANLLLDYYNKDIPEPNEVKIKTNEYRQENNPLVSWLEESIVPNEDSVVNLKDICYLYYGKEISKREKTKTKKEVEKWISKKYPYLEHLCKDSRFNGVKYSGWKGLVFIDNEDI